MESVGIDADGLDAILVSHEHGDHLQGVGVLARRHQVPVYLTPGTMGACNGQLSKGAECRAMEPGSAFEVGELGIHPFAVPHDAAEPVGFVFRHGGRKAGVATDVGFITALMRQHLMGCNLLVLESNHDPEMLRNGPYPWELKRRISGRSGHLSNEDAGRLLERVMHRGLEEVVLAHLSEKNNSPALARSAVEGVLSRYRMLEKVKVQVASPKAVVTAGSGDTETAHRKE